MIDWSNASFPDAFSSAHVERLRYTYARVLPLIGIWVATFLYNDWHRDPWSAATNCWITVTLFVASAVLFALPKQTLKILRGTLWMAFFGFGAGIFLDYLGFGRASPSDPMPRTGEQYGLALLIIAAHTLHAPSGARLVGLFLWIYSSLAALGGAGLSWFNGTLPPNSGVEALRFILSGIIALGLMDIFSQISGLQVRSAAQNSLLQQYALTDALTKLPNRRAFQTACEKEFLPACRDGQAMSLIVLDVDRFKQINDVHGHDAGDRVLQQLAQVVKSVVRSTDYPVRWGGDEFAILLPECSLSHARLMAEKIRLTVESFPFDSGAVTVSLGTAQLSLDNSVASLFRRADQALYEAKRLGRNRIETDRAAAGADSVERLRLALHHKDDAPADPGNKQSSHPST